MTEDKSQKAVVIIGDRPTPVQVRSYETDELRETKNKREREQTHKEQRETVKQMNFHLTKICNQLP
jgi:FtsZ-binding cell division protein ZapB